MVGKGYTCVSQGSVGVYGSRLRALDLRGCNSTVQLTKEQTLQLRGLQIVLAPHGFSMHPAGLSGCQLRWFSGHWAMTMPLDRMACLVVMEVPVVSSRPPASCCYISWRPFLLAIRFVMTANPHKLSS